MRTLHDYRIAADELARRKGTSLDISPNGAVASLGVGKPKLGHWQDARELYVWVAETLGVALVMDDNGDYWPDTGQHWHYYYAVGPYLPDTVDCLHGASDDDALAYLRDRVREYVDDYACSCESDSCECVTDRYTPTDAAESVAYGVADSELHDIGNVSDGHVSVSMNEWDYATIERVANADCACYADYVINPDTHECEW